MEKNIDPPSLIRELLIGFCLGTANIIPGVSGGTFLLIFKIYERVFSTLSNINRANILKGCVCGIKIMVKGQKSDSLKTLIEFLRENDFIFLFKLITGAVAAIFFLSGGMKYLIVHHFSAIYALFFGLILISILIPMKMLTHKKVHLILFAVLGAVVTIYVTAAVNPYEKVKIKSDSYQGRYLKSADVKQEKSDIKVFSFIGKYTPDEYIYAAACGAVAVSAMVLPGISGSLVLILMGEYFEVISAISGLKTLTLDNLAFLGCFAMGILLGGLLFARLLNSVLKRYYNITMAFLIGLMAGSLYALWPFKKSIVMAHQYVKKEGVIRVVQNVRVYTNINELPQMGSEFYISIACFIMGCILMSFFIGKEKKL